MQQPPKKGGGCLKWVFWLMAGSFMCCCCLGGFLAEEADDPLQWKALTPAGPEASLGLALVPGDLPQDAARLYHWRLQRERYGLGYGLSREVHQQLDDDFEAQVQRFNYVEGAGNKFTWVAPPGCRNREWQCLFDALAADSADDVAPLTELFRVRQQQGNLNALQVTELVVSFVQNIEYRQPHEKAFGMLAPALVAADGSGDCDSKALLAVIILRQLGVDAVVLLGSPLEHAALGVALPVPGKKFAHAGKKYAFVEVTQPGWVVGSLPPQYDVPKAWKVLPIEVP